MPCRTAASISAVNAPFGLETDTQHRRKTRFAEYSPSVQRGPTMDRPNMTNCRRTRGTEGRPWSRVDDEASMGLAAGTIGNWLTSGIVSFGYKHFWKIWIALLSICLVGYLVASQALLLVAISGLWIFLLPFFGFSGRGLPFAFWGGDLSGAPPTSGRRSSSPGSSRPLSRGCRRCHSPTGKVRRTASSRCERRYGR